MYSIGYDIGSSSIKIALVEETTGKMVRTLQEPKNEMDIVSLRNGWAEQNPITWWNHLCKGTQRILAESKIDASKIKYIGISYQMHGLIVLDREGNPLRPSIIWCDSRAVKIGESAFKEIGEEKCVAHLLNSPGNFTASKLKWVKDNEPEIYSHIYKFMLPGDYINYKLTGEMNTTKNGLSEGVLWDYKQDSIAEDLLNHYGIQKHFVPEIIQNFTEQGTITKKASMMTGLPIGAKVTYRAGDQPNNALSLNVLEPGEVAVTGGTSGVVYAVTDNLATKESSRINNFAHVNYSSNHKRIGKLLCINGAGIQYRWLLNNFDVSSYDEMNELASSIPVGSQGAILHPFGNGAERMLNNRVLGTRLSSLNLNIHTKAHLCRAALEGIAFSFVYGMEIMTADGIKPKVIRAGNDNLFRSEIFSNTIATLLEQEIEIYNTTGAIGAARASGLMDGNFKKLGDDIMENDHVMTYIPIKNKTPYKKAYTAWKNELKQLLNNN